MASVIVALAQDLDDVREPTVSRVMSAVRLAMDVGGDAPSPPPPMPEVHLMVAGSKRHASTIDIHNKHSDRSDWDRAWTSGEQFFTEVCYAVGMDRFGPRTGLWAQLIDVGPSDGLREIAAEVQHTLRRKQCRRVATVSVLLPPHVLASPRGQRAMEDVRRSFLDAWSGQDSPLRGAAVAFVTSDDGVGNPPH